MLLSIVRRIFPNTLQRKFHPFQVWKGWRTWRDSEWMCEGEEVQRKDQVPFTLPGFHTRGGTRQDAQKSKRVIPKLSG